MSCWQPVIHDCVDSVCHRDVHFLRLYKSISFIWRKKATPKNGRFYIFITNYFKFHVITCEFMLSGQEMVISDQALPMLKKDPITLILQQFKQHLIETTIISNSSSRKLFPRCNNAFHSDHIFQQCQKLYLNFTDISTH